jgi:hypothetical protein
VASRGSSLMEGAAKPAAQQTGPAPLGTQTIPIQTPQQGSSGPIQTQPIPVQIPQPGAPAQSPAAPQTAK